MKLRLVERHNIQYGYSYWWIEKKVLGLFWTRVDTYPDETFYRYDDAISVYRRLLKENSCDTVVKRVVAENSV